MNADRMTRRVQEALNAAYQRALQEHHTQHLSERERTLFRELAEIRPN